MYLQANGLHRGKTPLSSSITPLKTPVRKSSARKSNNQASTSDLHHHGGRYGAQRQSMGHQPLSNVDTNTILKSSSRKSIKN